MRTKQNGIASLALLSLGSMVLTPMSAHALTINSASVAFSNSINITDLEGGGSTTNSGASLGSSQINQFDANLGVLTGAAIGVSSTRTQSIQVKASNGPDNGNNNSVTTSGTGSNTTTFTATGVSKSSTSMTANGTCTGNRLEACTGTKITNSSSTNMSGAVDTTALDGYVGAGTTQVNRSASLLSATQSNNFFTGTESTQYDLTWSGTISATYNYLLHAAPSFDGASSVLSLNLDFGNVFQGDLANLEFSLFNLANSDRIGLDLDSIIGSGDTSALFSDLISFSDLIQGLQDTFVATMDTSKLGSYAASYQLMFSDADFGAETSRRNYNMTLNLTGNVLGQPARVSSVPEPASLALLGIGLAGFLTTRRKRQTA